MKYIFLNDIQYLFCKRRGLLGVLLLFPCLLAIFFATYIEDMNEIVFMVMGNHLNVSTSNYLEFVMFLFHLSIFIYLLFDIYIKDIKYQLDNIFLRISVGKWFVQKTYVFIIIMFFLKSLEYFLLLIPLLFFPLSITVSDIIKYLFVDFCYFTFCQFSLLFFYLLGYFKKLFFVIGIVFVCVFPKDIISLCSYFLLLLVGTFLLILFMKIIFQKKSKEIIQCIGGI